MALTLQTIVTTQIPASARFPPSPVHFLNPQILLFSSPNSKSVFPSCTFSKSESRLFPIKAAFNRPYGDSKSQIDGRTSASYEFNLDGFLSILEFLCLASSAAISMYVAVCDGVQKFGSMGSRIWVWQCVVLVSGTAIGAIIRRRQWRRIRGAGFSRGLGSDGANLLGRVEKLEEDLQSSATIIRVLSRQLEKLGIRVRVTRKTLKEPIAETAALAQKNSEMTRALAEQEDALEKELGEIQKVLLAMQEQQQKQLDLILAIAKAGKLWESENLSTKAQKAASSNPSKSSPDQAQKLEINQVESPELQKQPNMESS